MESTGRQLDVARGNRIKEARERLGINQAELGEKIGKVRQSISKFEQGYGFHQNTGKKLAKALNVSLAWLMDGVTNQLVLDTTKVSPVKMEEGQMQLRYFDMRVSATFKDLCNDSSNVWQWETVPFYEKRYLNAVIFKVDGDSMEPLIQDSALVICTPIEKSDWMYQSDGVYIVAFANQFVIKRLIKNSQTEGIITLKSDNPYKLSVIDVNYSELHCMWKVEEVYRQKIR